MNFWVKLLSIFLILATLSTVFASCAPQSTSKPANQGGIITDNGITVYPSTGNGGNNNNNNNNNGNHVGGVVVGNATAPYIGDVHVSAGVTPDENNQVPSEGVSLESATASATIPGGVQMDEGANELALTINGIKDSAADVTLSDTEISSSLDVHVSGVAAGNLVPMEVKLLAAALKGLNSTSITLYHVENGETIAMTYVPSNEPFTAHNQFKYDPVTGDVTLYIASFSEIMMVADTENAWEGKFDYTWYDADAEELYIANADQLAGFSAIVGGMNGQTQDSFSGKTVKLIADINLADDEANNVEGKIFYPIGYNSSDGKYERTGVAVTTGFYNFCGTFDGNGHTIANFYHNTWEMKGDNNYYDATLQYYRDGMGLFGKVYGGTVKNLTVSNFSSDGEYTTTGVVAAYADCGATFENISIFECNPRVYNIGNGGIVGCVGWYSKTGVTDETTDEEKEALKVKFKNITVDNSNKISALWGSYDVACGGILGQYYPTSGQSSANYPVNAGISFENCHVSAIMDVYNDVCANYQYYAYRYTGMLIGSVRENETIDGRVYPKMEGITASGCTVHFGTWNDYYYCEIIDNTTASYTHDYQMSRLTQVENVDVENKKYIPLGETEWIDIPTTGMVNFVVVDGEHATENATCYHFKNGEVYKHENQGLQDGIDEDGDGQIDLKEDKQHIYLEFNNLFTGYGWGVTSVGLETYKNVNVKDKLADIEIGGGDVEGSETKFDFIYEGKLEIGKTYTLGELFAATGNGSAIKNDNVVVTISSDSGKVDFNYNMDTTDWTKATLKINTLGNVTITISDYYYCKSTSITVNVDKAHKFEYLYGENRNGAENPLHKDFLLRVGNQNAIALESIFALKNGFTNTTNVKVTVTNGTYSNTASDWKKQTINFANYTGIATITIEDDYSYPCTIKVEIVDGTNVTGLSGTISGNVVLLNDCGISSLTVSGRNTVYGNGFTATYSGDGLYLNNGLKQGVITVKENGTLDNLRIVAPIYPYAFMYFGSAALGDYVKKLEPAPSTDGKTRYYYQLSTVALSGNGTISNCYIYGGRNNVFVDTGDVTIKDTILECGVVANVQIQSDNNYTITLENVTTIQKKVNATIGDTSRVMMGAGIIVGPETTTNPTIVLNGEFKQYNWVNAEDKTAVSDAAAKKIIEAAVNADAYNHTINDTKYSNLGIIYMNTSDATVENNTGLPYAKGTISINGVDGQVYSVQNATEKQIYSDYANADKSTVNSYYVPQFSYPADLGGQKIPDEGGDEFFYREGDTIKVMFPSGGSKEIDLASLVNIVKYVGQDLDIQISVKNSKGDSVSNNNGKIVLSAADTYTVTYTVTDTVFYDKDGKQIANTLKYSWNVTIDVSLKDTALPDAYFEFDTSKQKMGYYKPTIGDVKQYIPFLAGLKIYDYNGQEAYLRFNGDTDFNKVASITVTNKYSGNDALVVVKLTDGGVITLQLLARADSGGGSDYTGSIKTSNNTIYFVNNGGTSSKDATTTKAYWYIDYYKFTGNNGVEITSGQQTFNSTGSSASTPSGSFSTKVNYTVTYDANSGNCGQTTGYATSASAAVTLPTPSRSGYIFAGWYTAASGGTRVGGAGDSYTPSANVTLYAQWGKPCDVTYNANGGSCGTTSAHYDGTALTLPTATRDGYWFVGWYDAAEGGNKIGDAGAKYNPANEITLYAHWQEKIEYTVTYNANGGNCGTASATYQGTALILPTPTRTGYTFNGWYTAASGGTKIGDAGASYTPSANVTLYAQWTINSYKVTLDTSNATITGVTNGQTIAYDTKVSVTVSFDKNNSKTFTVKDASGNTILSKSAAGTYEFTMPASDVTISASSSGCFAEGTLITLADGTQKPIEEITFEDELLAWDFNTGTYVVTVPSLIESYDLGYFRVINLNFADGTTVRVVTEHGFFDVEANNFVYIDETNVDSYVGHNFVKVAPNGTYESVELVGYEVTVENVRYYTIQTAIYNNCIAENMFTLTSPPEMLDNDEWFDYFEIGEGMKYDEEKMQADIAKYGLYTYEDFAEYVTYEQFIAFNGPYLKVLVGRGVLTFEEILELIATYVA